MEQVSTIAKLVEFVKSYKHHDSKEVEMYKNIIKLAIIKSNEVMKGKDE